jgi:hypothetical protein
MVRTSSGNSSPQPGSRSGSNPGERPLPVLPSAKATAPTTPDPGAMLSPKQGGILLPGLTGSPHQLRKVVKKDPAEQIT